MANQITKWILLNSIHWTNCMIGKNRYGNYMATQRQIQCMHLWNWTYQFASIVSHNVWVWDFTKKIYFLSIQKKKNHVDQSVKQEIQTVIFIKRYWLLSQLKWITGTQYNFLNSSFEFGSSIRISFIAQKSSPRSLHYWTEKVMHFSKLASNDK